MLQPTIDQIDALNRLVAQNVIDSTEAAWKFIASVELNTAADPACDELDGLSALLQRLDPEINNAINFIATLPDETIYCRNVTGSGPKCTHVTVDRAIRPAIISAHYSNGTIRIIESDDPFRMVIDRIRLCIGRGRDSNW